MRDVTALLLAGGLGTRIQHLAPDLPKPMIPFQGRPFIEWVVRYLHGQGVDRFLLSTGYLANKVAEHFAANSVPSVQIDCKEETEPLGTAGAILYHLPNIKTELVLAGNGDSLVKFPFNLMHETLQPDVEGVLLGLRQPDCSRFGKLSIDPNGRLLGFAEKSPGPGVINAGVYLLRKSILEHAEKRYPLSIEKDYFPERLAAGAKYKVVETEGPFLDIGTPESLAAAGDWISANRGWLEGR